MSIFADFAKSQNSRMSEFSTVLGCSRMPVMNVSQLGPPPTYQQICTCQINSEGLSVYCILSSRLIRRATDKIANIQALTNEGGQGLWKCSLLPCFYFKKITSWNRYCFVKAQCEHNGWEINMQFEFIASLRKNLDTTGTSKAYIFHKVAL